MSPKRYGNIAFRIAKYALVLLFIMLFLFVGYFILTGKSLSYSILNASSKQESFQFEKLVVLKKGEVLVTNARVKERVENYLVYVDLLPKRDAPISLAIDLRCFKISSKNRILYQPDISGDSKIGNYTALEISNDKANPTSVFWQFAKEEKTFEQFLEQVSGHMDITYTDFVSGKGCSE